MSNTTEKKLYKAIRMFYLTKYHAKKSMSELQFRKLLQQVEATVLCDLIDEEKI